MRERLEAVLEQLRALTEQLRALTERQAASIDCTDRLQHAFLEALRDCAET
ncbi:MAG: hypothetical protein AB7K71_03340 [Polyangiaceae bacterium]